MCAVSRRRSGGRCRPRPVPTRTARRDRPRSASRGSAARDRRRCSRRPRGRRAPPRRARRRARAPLRDALLLPMRDLPCSRVAWPKGTLAPVPSALAVRDLRKRFGAVHALKGVDLEVGEGELVGLLGPNGAGKSTLVKILVGLVRPSGGTAEVAGARAGSHAARAALGYLAELFRFPGWYTADEVLELHQRLAGSTGGAAERKRLLELVVLDEAADRRVDGMSKGMQQRLGIAQALVGEPRVLLLDEPTSALDPVGRRIVRELLENLRDRGTSVLLNSHLLSEIELVCDRVAILRGGELIAAGAPHDLAR